MGQWISAGGVPVYLDDQGNPTVPDPSVASAPEPGVPPAPQPAPGTSIGTSEANRVGSSSSTVAMDPRIYGAVEGADRAILQREPSVLAQEQSRLAPQVQGYAQSAGDAYGAQGRIADVQAAQAGAQAAGDKAIADLDQRFAGAEESGRKIAAARAQASRAGYETQLRQWAASGVQIPDTGVAGAVTAFVTDFLGARGIHSSGLDLLNQAVDRSVQVQLDNMRHGGEVTQEFRALWQQALAEGDSESDARAKIFGYHLAGAQAQVAAEVAKYGGPLAQAQGAAAQAQIEEQLQTHLAAIQDTAYQRAQAQVQRLLDTEHQAQSLAIQRSSVGAQWYNANTERQKLDLAKKANPGQREMVKDLNERIIIDPQNPNHLLGAAHTKEQADKLREELPKWASTQEKLANLRDLLANRDLYMGPLNQWTADKYDNAVKAAWADARTDFLYMKSGAQYSDKFMEEMKVATPIDSWSTNPDIIATYSRLISDGIDNADRFVHAQVNPLVPWEQDLVDQRLVSGVGSAEPTAAARDADVKLGMQPDHGKAPLDEVDKASGLVSRTTSGTVSTASARRIERDLNLPTGAENSMPEWEEGMNDLYHLAQDKDPGTREEARQALSDYATGAADGDQDKQHLATYYLGMLPEEAPDVAPSELQDGGDYGKFDFGPGDVRTTGPMDASPPPAPGQDFNVTQGIHIPPRAPEPPSTLTDEQVHELLKKYGHISSPQLP